MPSVTQSFPQAILHIDADSFFAACEQALNPKYQGKPIVTGQERGIAVAMSIEAKKLGITRGMPVVHIKRQFPKVIIVPGNYEAYSLFSKRIFSIVRRYTPIVEEYSIDECFADITGLRRPLNMSYQSIGRAICDAVKKELGISVSIGLGSTKSIAKIASKLNKPNGFTPVSNRAILRAIGKLPVDKIWGVGKNTSKYMRTLGIRTIGQFITKPYDYICQELTKPHREIWKELNGEAVYAIVPEEKMSYVSISKTKTFTPTNERYILYSQLMKNIENACIKARKYKLVTKRINIFLKQNDFTINAIDIKLTRATAFPSDIVPLIRPLFNQLYRDGVVYRSTGVVLGELQENNSIQTSLFESPLKLKQLQRIYESIDHLAARYGKNTVYTAATIQARKKSILAKTGVLRNKINTKKFIGIPRFATAV